MPSTRNCVPETITRSPALSPKQWRSYCRRSGPASPECGAPWSSRSAASTTNTKLCSPCCDTASTGTIAMGFVLQMTLALINSALRSISCVASHRAPSPGSLAASCPPEAKRNRSLVFSSSLPLLSVRSTPKPPAHLGGALSGHVDVGFEILVLIHRGEQGRRVASRRNVVAYVHRNVAHDAGIGSADRVVGEQLFLRFAVALGCFVIRFGVLVRLLRLVVSVAAGYACFKELCSGGRARWCRSRRPPFSAAPWPAEPQHWPVAGADRSASAPGRPSPARRSAQGSL